MLWVDIALSASTLCFVAGPLWSLRCLYVACDQRQAAMEHIARLTETRQIGFLDFRAAAIGIMKVDPRDHAFRLLTFRDPWAIYPADVHGLIAGGP